MSEEKHNAAEPEPKSSFFLGSQAIPEIPPAPLWQREAVKKLIWFFLASFRRKPESRFFTDLRIDWTPVFTGVTNEFQFFHIFRGVGGISESALANQSCLTHFKILLVGSTVKKRRS